MKRLLLPAILALTFLAPKANAQLLEVYNDVDGSFSFNPFLELQLHFPGCVSSTGSIPDTVWLDTTCADISNVTELVNSEWDSQWSGAQLTNGLQYFVNCTSMLGFYTRNQLPPNLKTWKLTDAGPAIWDENLNGPSLPESLDTLDFVESTWHLGPLPNGLQYLSMQYNYLDSLPQLPDSLTYLKCESSMLDSVPDLPSGLQHLDLYDCSIYDLPALPSGLKYLDCWGCNLDSIPELPSTLEYLEIGHNSLQSPLPVLPPGLKHLGCELALAEWSNPLGLPELPPQLEYLNCNFCDLREFGVPGLPELPNSLKHLSCAFNDLDSLPALPPGLEVLFVSGNGNLECLPYLPYSLEQLFYQSTDITCLPNLPNSSFWGEPLCTGTTGCEFQPVVTGRIFHDVNENCNDEAELPLAGRVVESSFGTYAMSDTAGMYNLWLEPGTYTVDQQIPNPVWEVNCSGIPHTVTMDTLFQHIPGIDFPNQAPNACPWLVVNVGAGPHRPCFENVLNIQYCNNGSADAADAYIDVQFPPYVFPISSSPIDFQALGAGVYRFDLGDLEIDECGAIQVIDSVPCDMALLGLTACFTSEVFPPSPCFEGGPAWDNSSVFVSGECEGSDIKFVLKNVGSGDMTNPSTYRIYEDNALEQNNTSFQLNSGDSLVLTVPADGSLFRLEADQVDDHPGLSLPRASVEACGPTPWSLGIFDVPQQNDLDDHISTDCVPLTGSYDPNDKRVIPAGYGPQNWVHPNDSILEYTIRFQNTGTDTAFNIDVVDTLDVALLDPLTFVSGVSSHPYTVTMHGEGVVTWHFEDVLLPDSFVNEPLSNGFVKFKIDARQGLPIGTVINNSAAIYFDYNEAIITNTAFITLYDGQILTSTQNLNVQAEVTAQPNPFINSTAIRWNVLVSNGILELRDAVGRLIRSEQTSGVSHDLVRDGLPNGLYFVSLTEQGRVVGNVRVVIAD